MAALALLMSMAVVTNTWAGDEIPIPLIEIPPGNDGGGDGNGGGNPDPKSPAQIPYITQDGHTLYLYSGCVGGTLVLLDEFEDEVYSIQMTDEMDEIILPSSLSGTYTILVIQGSLTFGAEIEL